MQDRNIDQFFQSMNIQLPILMERYFWAIALSVLMAIWVGLTPPIRLADVPKADGKHYVKMAEAAPSVDIQIPAPFGYRILPPFWAGILPFSTDFSFKILSVFGLMLLPFLWFIWLKAFSVPIKVASFLCLMMNPHLIGFVAFNPYQLCDVITFVLLLSALIALRANEPFILGFLLLIGVLTRETLLLMIPFGALYLYHKQASFRDYFRYGIAIIPALFVMVSIRYYFEPTNAGQWSFWQAFLISGGDALKPVSWGRILLNAFAPFALLPLFYFREISRFLSTNWHYSAMVAMVLMSCFIAKDKERLIAILFPLVYLFIAKLMQKYAQLIWILPLCAFPIGIRYLLQTPDEMQRVIVILLNLFVGILFLFNQKSADVLAHQPKNSK